MQHLVDELGTENILIQRRMTLASTSSFIFNVIIFIACIGGFAFFLYTQHKSVQERPPDIHIPFKPSPWHSATRNVRMNEYGEQLQPFEIEVGYGIS